VSKEAPQETKTITLSHLIRDDKFQVRRKLDQPTISRYVEVLKAGSSMPPIKVAYINGAPVLIDGWHRVEAMERSGRVQAEASVLQVDTEKEIYWLAAKANMEHGLPLKPSEKRQVFRAYVKAGQHEKRRGRYKSYREMQSDLTYPHTTIRNWMHKDFRHIAAKIGGNDEFKGKGGLMSSHDSSSLQDSAMQGLDQAQQVFQSTVDPEVRGEIISRMDALLSDMKQAGNWKLPPAPDF
jgi:hypothetical protein